MIILASQSPRRRELLQKLNIPFTVRVADVDETMDKHLPLTEAVAQLSRRKAEGVFREEEDIVIAADTIVVLGDTVLGKPRDEADAFRMLSLLSGREHQVMTGLTVLKGQRALTHTEITDIHFRALTPGEIRAYIRTGDPMDKAGSYGIQNGGALFAEKLVGDYFNVVGLPVCRLGQLLKQIDPDLMEDTQ